MRLIHTKTGRFHDFDDPRTVRYAILSHVWARRGEAHFPEMTYQDVLRIQDSQVKQGSTEPASIVSQFPDKIKRFCEVAAEHEYEYAWADACCIDKTSSSELSEVINSMYDWYRYADVCYVFLPDVPTPAMVADLHAPGSAFQNSRWHKRGWTLQELLAPGVVVFFSSEWNIIGTKHTLAALIHAITGIDRDVLTFQRPLEEFSVACRMSWAASRETSREEDEAYSLMGIFQVNMPTTYGEGRYAFIRLQEEILKHISDQTIFAWGATLPEHNFSYHPFSHRSASDLLSKFSVVTSSPEQFLLASSPKDFRYSSNLTSIPWDEFMRTLGAPLGERPRYMTTSYGVRTRLPVLAVRAKDQQTNVPTCIALLACKDNTGRLMSLLLRSQPQRPDIDFYVGAVVGQLRDVMGSIDAIDPFAMSPAYLQYYYRTASLSRDDLRVCCQRFQTENIYIPYRPSLASHSLQRDVPFHSALRSVTSNTFDLRVSKWSQDLLGLHGYNITSHRDRDPFTIDITSAADAHSETISIYFGRCNCHFGDKERYLSIDVSLSRGHRSVMHTTPAPHKKNHDAHIQSWTFRNGSASKEFHLRANTERRVTIRLTLTKSTEARHMYILGVEIWKTLEEDVERERKRLKSMVTRKKDATSERHTPHLEAKDMASPLLRPRSTSHPPSVFTPAVSVGSPEASQYEPLPSPGIGTHVSVGTSSSLMTPPMSRTSSRKNGVVEDPWEFLTDAESWAGIGHGRSDDGSARMDIDPITADPSPLPSPLTPYFSQPVPTTVIHRVPDPVPSATSHSKPPLPRKANTLDIPRAGPSRPYPPFRLEIDAASDDDHVNLGWTHGRQAAHTALDTDRRTEQRFTLPDPSPAPTAHPTSSSMWSAEPPPFRGSPQPMERDTEEESSRPSSTNNDPGSAKKAPRKATGKRRRTVDAEATSMGHPLSGSEPTVGVARESPGSRPPGGRKRKSLTPGARQGNAEAGSSSSPADSTSNTRARRRATVQRTGREDSQGARRPRQGSGWGRGRVGGGEASGSRNAEGAGGYDEPPAKRRET